MHKLIGAWSREMGQSFESTKIMFKFAFGVWLPYPFDGPAPDWPGQFVHMYEGTPDEHLIYMMSEAAYDRDQEHALVTGVKAELHDAGVDLSWMEDK